MTTTRIHRLRPLAAVFSIVIAFTALAGCSSHARTGALFGASLGALAGQAISGDSEATVHGAAIGAAIGYAIGNEADHASPPCHCGYRHGPGHHRAPHHYCSR